MPLQILHSGRPLPESAIQRVEKELGYPLPADYRAWIAQHNGGSPKPSWFQLESGERNSPSPARWHRLDGLYELENSAPLAISALGMSRLLREAHQPEPPLPHRLLPIGGVDDDFLLLLSLDGSDTGCVYYWSMYSDEFWEIEHDEFGEPEDTALDLVAKSFDEFLACLTEPPQEVLNARGFDPAAETESFNTEALLSQLPEAERQQAQLQMLAMGGTTEAARQAMDEGLSPDKLLMLAGMFGNRNAADAARERLGDRPGWPPSEGFSMAFWSDVKAVRERLDQGAPLGGPTPDDATPLHGAAAAGAIDSMQLLLDAGADPAARSAAGKTPLHCAAAGPERAEAVAFLLSRGAPAGVFDQDGHLALHKAIGMPGCVETMQRLIDGGEDLHARAGFSTDGPMPEGLEKMMRAGLAQLASMGDPFQPPPDEALDDDPELRGLFQQLADSPMAQMARGMVANPNNYIEQRRLQLSQGRTAAEMLQTRLVPVGKRMVPGAEVAKQLDEYQRKQRSQ